jgi:hypothetical protein
VRCGAWAVAECGGHRPPSGCRASRAVARCLTRSAEPRSPVRLRRGPELIGIDPADRCGPRRSDAKTQGELEVNVPQTISPAPRPEACRDDVVGSTSPRPPTGLMAERRGAAAGPARRRRRGQLTVHVRADDDPADQRQINGYPAPSRGGRPWPRPRPHLPRVPGPLASANGVAGVMRTRSSTGNGPSVQTFEPLRPRRDQCLPEGDDVLAYLGGYRFGIEEWAPSMIARDPG